MSRLTRSTIAIFRDCIRAAEHLGGQSKKAEAIKSNIRMEFKKNMHLTDPAKIEELRECAITGLSNYLTVHSLSQLRKKPSVERTKLAQKKAIEARLEAERQQIEKEKSVNETVEAQIEQKR